MHDTIDLHTADALHDGGAHTPLHHTTRSGLLLATIVRDDRGLTTAEYAVGTCAVAGLGGLLIKLLTSDGMRDLIWSLISKAFGGIFGF